MIQQQYYFLASLCLIIAAGCSGGDEREYGSLSGIVTINGNPAPAGTIVNMINLKNGAATSAQVRDGGEYQIPRVQVGTYQVGFTPQGEAAVSGEIDPDQAMKQIEEGTYQAPDPSKEIPEDLRSPETSGQTVEISLGENMHDFNL